MYVDTEAVIDIVANPACYILGSWVEGENVVEDFMVHFFFEHALYMREISDHAGIVECLGTAMHGNNPIMTVYGAALALIRQIQPVCSRNLYAFGDIVHTSAKIQKILDTSMQ